MTIPTAYQGMDVAWPYKRRQLGDSVTFTCPSSTATWEGVEEQVAACAWHRQTDSMVWWPPELHACNSESRNLSPAQPL